ncbi:hypothetical protein BBJ28_00007581, partial [Nothophytophthora sp. Chile5]
MAVEATAMDETVRFFYEEMEEDLSGKQYKAEETKTTTAKATTDAKGDDQLSAETQQAVQYILENVVDGRTLLEALRAAINTNSVVIDEPRRPFVYKDATFTSGHKFIGGPGSPGALIVKKRLLTNAIPTTPGGGTPFFVTENDHRCLSNRAEREEGGTPDTVSSIRLSLAFQLKQLVGTKNIKIMEERHVQRQPFNMSPTLRAGWFFDDSNCSKLSFAEGFLGWGDCEASTNSTTVPEGLNYTGFVIAQKYFKQATVEFFNLVKECYGDSYYTATIDLAALESHSCDGNGHRCGSLAMSLALGRRLASSTSSGSVMATELPSNVSFHFDGTNSDLAQQLYYRWLAGDSAEQLTLTKVPATVRVRLDDLNVKWVDLDGLAQRAVLWDSGFGVSSANEPIQIWTDGTHTMADLAVARDDFLSAGCEDMNCTQPDGTEAYSNLLCTGSQMLKATRCVVENFEDSAATHTSMWATGGGQEMIPTPHVRQHAWEDAGTSTEYIVFAVHTLDESEKETAYAQCPVDGDYGSMIIPCCSTASLDSVPGGVMVAAEESAWVSRWLAEHYASTSSVDGSGTGAATIAANTSNDSLGTAAIAGIVVGCVIVLLVILGIVFRRRVFQGKRSDTNHETAILQAGNTASLEGVLRGQMGLWDDNVITAKRIPRDKVRILKLISRGAFGEVYTGVFNGRQVAVKMLLPETRDNLNDVNEFLAEAKMTAIMDHPRIVSFVGVAWDALSDLCVVLEFVDGGDLRTLLNKYEADRHPVGFGREKATIALHVCHA